MDPDFIADLFSAFGAVTRRRLFGGAGLYADGVMFAIEVRVVIYLKADGALAADLEGRGAVPFSYQARGVTRTLSGFWSVPEVALDDPEDLAALARRALLVAHQAAAARKPARVRKVSPSEGKAAKASAPKAGASKAEGSKASASKASASKVSASAAHSPEAVSSKGVSSKTARATARTSKKQPPTGETPEGMVPARSVPRAAASRRPRKAPAGKAPAGKPPPES